MLNVLHDRNKCRPFLRVGTAYRLHQYQLIGHHHLMFALAESLVPWRQSRPQQWIHERAQRPHTRCWVACSTAGKRPQPRVPRTGNDAPG